MANRHDRPFGHGAPSINDIFAALEREVGNPRYQEDEEKQAKESGEMWRVLAYNGDSLVLDHAQDDFGKVFRFTMGMLAELHNQGVKDYRITMQNKKGDLYFFSIGEKTPVSNFKKASS